MKHTTWADNWQEVLEEVRKRILKSGKYSEHRDFDDHRRKTIIFTRRDTYPLVTDLFYSTHTYTIFWMNLHQTHPEVCPNIAVSFDLDSIEIMKYPRYREGED